MRFFLDNDVVVSKENNLSKDDNRINWDRDNIKLIGVSVLIRSFQDLMFYEKSCEAKDKIQKYFRINKERNKESAIRFFDKDIYTVCYMFGLNINVKKMKSIAKDILAGNDNYNIKRFTANNDLIKIYKDLEANC